MLRSLRYFASIAVVGVGIAALLYLRDTRQDPEPITVEERSWPVAVISVQPGSLTPVATLFGRIESPRLTHISSALSAYVTEVAVAEGAMVRRGSRLIALDSRDGVLSLRQREAEIADLSAQRALELERHRHAERSMEYERGLLELTRSAVRRAEDLAQRDLGAQSQVDTVRADEMRQLLALETRDSEIRGHDSRLRQLDARLEQARALRDLAALDVERASVGAQFDGRVTEVLVSPGDRVRSGDRLLSLFDLTRLEVRAQIPSKLLPALRGRNGPGLRARMEVDGQALTVELDRLSGQAVPGRGGVDALFRIVDPAPWLQLGRTVQLALELPTEEDAIALPIESLYGAGRVFKVVDSRLSAVEVERLGEAAGGGGEPRILVRSSELRAGDRVVATQLPNAIEGLRARVLE